MSGSVNVLGNGLVGRGLTERLPELGLGVRTIGRSGCDMLLDLLNPGSFDFGALGGAPVVIAAAVSSPAACEADPRGSWAVNVDGTSAFAERALSAGCRVVFLSSDAVYASDPGEAYDESDDPSPRFAYGRQKAEVERRFANDPNFKAVRLSYVCAAGDKVTRYFLGCAARGARAEVFHPYYRSCTTLGDVARAVAWLAGSWGALPSRRLNVCGTELVSRVRLADELSWIAGLPGYDVVSPPRGFYACRPPVTRMRSLYLHDFGIVEERPFSKAYSEEVMGV